MSEVPLYALLPLFARHCRRSSQGGESIPPRERWARLRVPTANFDLFRRHASVRHVLAAKSEKTVFRRVV